MVEYFRYLKARVISSDTPINRRDARKHFLASCIVRAGDTVIDVGAHIGDYTNFYRDLVGPSGTVIAYEANPWLWPVLEKHLAHRSDRRASVHLRRLAASATSGQSVSLRLRPWTLAQDSTVEPLMMGAWRMQGPLRTIRAETEALDSLYRDRVLRLDGANVSPPALIKIDVEGHELTVMKGAATILRECRPVIIYEYSCSPQGVDPETISFMRVAGYRSFDVGALDWVEPGFIETGVTDLIAVPEERQAAFAGLLEAIGRLA